MLLRYEDRETSMALLSCQAYLRLPRISRFLLSILEQKRAYYLLEDSYVNNFRM